MVVARAKAKRSLEIQTAKAQSDALSPTSGSEWSSSTSKPVNSRSRTRRRAVTSTSPRFIRRITETLRLKVLPLKKIKIRLLRKKIRKL